VHLPLFQYFSLSFHREQFLVNNKQGFILKMKQIGFFLRYFVRFNNSSYRDRIHRNLRHLAHTCNVKRQR
jgi:hypothetical protein